MENKMSVIILAIFVAMTFFIMWKATFQIGFNKGVQTERTRIWEKLNYCI